MSYVALFDPNLGGKNSYFVLVCAQLNPGRASSFPLTTPDLWILVVLSSNYLGPRNWCEGSLEKNNIKGFVPSLSCSHQKGRQRHLSKRAT